MRKITSIIIIVFSLLIVNGEEYQCMEKEDAFAILENSVLEEFEFCENGIKIEYEIEEDKIKELLRLEETLLNKDIDTIIKKDYSTNISNSEYSIDIKIFEDTVNKVEIVILNKNNEILTEELRQVLRKAIDGEVEGYREYLYVKVKLYEQKEDMNEVYNRWNISEIEILEIDNGKAIKGTLNNNTKINLGEINYNTGKYLIIGTPVIFTEY